MINFIAVKCPECNADLSIEEGRSMAFCTYCGAKVMINNENEHIYRHIDEAEIKKAETDHIVQMKKLEMADDQRQVSKKHNSLKIVVSLGLLVFGLIAMASGSGYAMMAGLFAIMAAAYMWLFSGIVGGNQNDDPTGSGIKVPSVVQQYNRMDYKTIEEQFKRAGFTNVQCIPIHDSIAGKLFKQNIVSHITINGMGVMMMKKYAPDVEVIIYYHG